MYGLSSDLANLLETNGTDNRCIVFSQTNTIHITLCVLTEGAAALGAVAGGGVGVPGSLVITTTAVAQHALAAAVASDAAAVAVEPLIVAADIPHQLEVRGASWRT